MLHHLKGDAVNYTRTVRPTTEENMKTKQILEDFDKERIWDAAIKTYSDAEHGSGNGNLTCPTFTEHVKDVESAFIGLYSIQAET